MLITVISLLCQGIFYILLAYQAKSTLEGYHADHLIEFLLQKPILIYSENILIFICEIIKKDVYLSERHRTSYNFEHRLEATRNSFW